MIFPERPTCHDNDLSPVFKTMAPEWRTREGGPHRRCSYCGSLHPEDLMKVLGEGARLGGADWKYGWPHKFYVYHGTEHLKWYNEHITDVGYDDEARGALLGVLEASGIKFFIDEGGRLAYSAPFSGYQR